MIKKIATIDFFGSEGCEMNLLHDGKKFTGSEPRNGFVNQKESISLRAKKCPKILNNSGRLTKPLMRCNDVLYETTFEEAFELIHNKIKNSVPEKNVFFAGARLTNEELYLIQKLARAGVQTNHIDSFHYLNRTAKYYNINKNDNIQLEELDDCGRIFLLGAELNVDNDIYYQLIQQLRNDKKIPVELITRYLESPMRPYVDQAIDVDSYYYFVKAVIYYLLSNNKECGLFAQALPDELQSFKQKVLSEKYLDLIEKSGIADMATLEDWAERYLAEPHAVIVYTEQELSSNTVRQLINLQMITGKLGIPSSGILSIKEKNNAQGLFDMGITSEKGVGYRDFSPEYIEQLKTLWNVPKIETTVSDVARCLLNDQYENMFIFGEDPVGCDMSEEVGESLVQSRFLVVQDYFLTETATMADVVLPATFPFETGGSFTNTVKQLQMFSKAVQSPVKMNNLEQLATLLQKFGITTEADPMTIFGEMTQLFELGCCGSKRHQFVYTEEDNDLLLFNSGCDGLMLMLDNEM
ncbi:MAG: molybdopterin-dependent oxidoreductase [Bacteroidales bacterium]|nr:molybdopterin-dependent oxidoreductase [Bacteroidales bacterium]